jgi:hypothetical protein
MMKSQSVFAVLIFSFFSTFLFGQIADNNSSAQFANESVAALTDRPNEDEGATPDSAPSSHALQTVHEASPRATLDLSGIDFLLCPVTADGVATRDLR